MFPHHTNFPSNPSIAMSGASVPPVPAAASRAQGGGASASPIFTQPARLFDRTLHVALRSGSAADVREALSMHAVKARYAEPGFAGKVLSLISQRPYPHREDAMDAAIDAFRAHTPLAELRMHRLIDHAVATHNALIFDAALKIDPASMTRAAFNAAMFHGSDLGQLAVQARRDLEPGASWNAFKRVMVTPLLGSIVERPYLEGLKSRFPHRATDIDKIIQDRQHVRSHVESIGATLFAA